VESFFEKMFDKVSKKKREDGAKTPQGAVSKKGPVIHNSC
jgi:hypothetical protein